MTYQQLIWDIIQELCSNGGRADLPTLRARTSLKGPSLYDPLFRLYRKKKVIDLKRDSIGNYYVIVEGARRPVDSRGRPKSTRG